MNIKWRGTLGFCFSIVILSWGLNARAEDGFNALLQKRMQSEAPVPAPEAAQPNAEKSQVIIASGDDAKAHLILRAAGHCYVVEFENRPGEIVSCKSNLPLDYTSRRCSNDELLERGKVDAVVSCEGGKRIHLSFMTQKDAVSLSLRVSRTQSGREGFITKYRVEHASVETGGLAHLLPQPEILPLDGSKPDEAPLKFKFSGFAWLEQEHTSKFGYDKGAGSQTALPNFSAQTQQASQESTTFFSNLNFELSKDNTSLVSIFEIGEIYFGDTSSGGAQGARATNIFEVRNLYLNHQLYDGLGLKGGLITTASDPRKFIFNDHIASIQANYKSDLSEGYFWYGNSSQNRPGAPMTHNQYLGFSGTLGFLSGVKATVFGLYSLNNTDKFSVLNSDGIYEVKDSKSRYLWAGTTLAYDGLNPLSAEVTAIANLGWADMPYSDQDQLTAMLLDAKVTYSWAAPQVAFTLEGLGTTGGVNTTDSTSGTAYTVLKTRKGFTSPIGAAYLMTIATSDGVDDAPGTPKQSIIAPLNQAEGLRIGVFTVAGNLSKRFTGFGRAGWIATEAASAVLNSRDLGKELDLGGVYQLSPSTTLQLDYGRFFPGAFYGTARNPADLATAKIKFIM